MNEESAGSCRLAKRVKPHNWLVATMAALFLLQAPFCALACFGGSEADPSAVAENSCHEESSDSSPAGESSSHEDCGCSFASEALVSQPIDANATTSYEIFVSPLRQSELTYSRTVQQLLVAQNADLPPPDILLLKSTFII